MFCPILGGEALWLTLDGHMLNWLQAQLSLDGGQKLDNDYFYFLSSWQMYNEIIAALEEAAKDESAITVLTGKTHKRDIETSETCVSRTCLN